MPRLLYDNGYVVCYTDGACINNGRQRAAAGFAVVFNIGHPWNECGPVQGRPTNNVAEIEAAIRAVEIAQENGVELLQIRTDSQFLVDSYYNYMDNWRQNGWRLYDGSPVKNAAQFQALDLAIQQGPMLSVDFRYVRGHSGDKYNNEADRLAKLGARQY